MYVSDSCVRISTWSTEIGNNARNHSEMYLKGCGDDKALICSKPLRKQSKFGVILSHKLLSQLIALFHSCQKCEWADRKPRPAEPSKQGMYDPARWPVCTVWSIQDGRTLWQWHKGRRQVQPGLWQWALRCLLLSGPGCTEMPCPVWELCLHLQMPL